MKKTEKEIEDRVQKIVQQKNEIVREEKKLILDKFKQYDSKI